MTTSYGRFWDMIADARKRGEPAGMHPRTYYPLAYAAVPAEELLDLLARDTERMAAWGDTYFDTHFSRAITRRLRRDASARAEDRGIHPDPRDRRRPGLLLCQPHGGGIPPQRRTRRKPDHPPPAAATPARAGHDPRLPLWQRYPGPRPPTPDPSLRHRSKSVNPYYGWAPAAVTNWGRVSPAAGGHGAPSPWSSAIRDALALLAFSSR